MTARADLLDRNGELVARDLPVHDLYAHPHAFWDKAGAAQDLAAATGGDARRLTSLFQSKHPYVLVARQLTPDQEDKVMHLGLPGLEFEPGAKRYYPDGRATAQVLGVTDPDNDGVSGLELGLDDQPAQRRHGALETSIDLRVQYILEDEIAQARQMFHAKAAGGLVMDVNTGEVLAIASLPDFDPNARSGSEGDSSRNIMAQDAYELGSVFKIMSFTLAMEDHTTTPDEVFQIGQGYKLGKYTIHEAEHMPAMLAARDVLAQSSNIGTAQIALRSGPDRQRAFLTQLGLLDPVPSELPETAHPHYPSHWGTIETATIGFGHGISVTPLSFVAAAAAVVNGGRKIVPTFLKHPEDARGEQLIKPETSVAMRTLLRYVVTDGTGRNADVPGLRCRRQDRLGGKAAGRPRLSAPMCWSPRSAQSSQSTRRAISFSSCWTSRMAPRQRRVIALAGYTAAPLAGRVISRIAPILGVPQTPPIAVAAREIHNGTIFGRDDQDG